ncbi:glycosyltransferase family 87 protein [Pseudarthrobacter sp. H3Y2-7]|uniref:glycosyltransferase family 87 protein n=1 Tax=Pseudarthrobacter naphthalenicus TaxID=3031328 RepID=UPI0023B0520F|nr:glycosyltransferase family 87 protein [Pseudarthrobacter sp. H3Y2-7]MDE8667147.1 glycosyltransferase family 87 protein [Pseudarthrobacter sp. H3Y2-7]
MSKFSDPRAKIADAPWGFMNGFTCKYPSATRLAVVLLWLLGILTAYLSIRGAVVGTILGQDAHAYWLAAQSELVYDRAPGQRDAYLYSPAFVAAIKPLATLSWPFFLVIWICLEAAILIWLVKPLQLRWSAPIFLLCLPELMVGNIYILLAGSAVVGMYRPAAWGFPILTKLTAGVGLLWFAARGEWSRFIEGIGGLTLVVIVLYALEPTQWQAWMQFLFEQRDGTPDSQTSFVLRCLLAALLVAIGAWKQRPWLIAPAMVLASPVLVGLIPLTMLAAIPRLNRLARLDANLSGPSLPRGRHMTKGF